MKPHPTEPRGPPLQKREPALPIARSHAFTTLTCLALAALLLLVPTSSFAQQPQDSTPSPVAVQLPANPPDQEE